MKNLIVLAVACLVGCAPVPPNRQTLLYVGTYTDTIHLLSFDEHTGVITPYDHYVGIANPSYLALADSVIYAVSEAGGCGSVVALTKKDLRKLWELPSYGNSPCYVDVKGQFMAVGNYGSGNFVIYSGDEPVANVSHGDSLTGANVHCTRFLGDELWVADLGRDKLYVYDCQGKLLRDMSTDVGSGPRHFDFHPTLPVVYLLCEVSGSIYVYSRNGEQLQVAREGNLADNVGSADVHLTGDGRFLYATYRGAENAIVVYKVDGQGYLQFVEKYPCGGLHPRNFVIAPGDKYLLVANRDSNNIVTFEIDPQSGALTYRSDFVVTKPVCLKF